MRATRIVLPLLLLGLISLPCAAQDLTAEINAAKSAFSAGKKAQAVVHMEKILKAQPSADQVQKLRNVLMTGTTLIKMLEAGGDLEKILRYFMTRAESVKIARITDPKEIENLVATFVEGETDDKFRAIIKLQGLVGARAVPYFIHYLSDEESTEYRANAILGLQKLGEVTVIPLVQVLKSDDKTQVENVVLVLGNIGDARAAGALKALAEDTGQDTSIRKTAEDALRKLRGLSSNPLSRKAADYHLDQARRFYAEDTEIMPDMGADTLHWQWEDDKLKFRKIPPFLVNEMLAEESCYGTLHSAPSNQQAWQLLLLTYLSEHAEIRDLLIAAKESKSQLSSAEKALLDKAKMLLWRIHSMTALGGAKALDGALALAIADGKDRLAVEAATFLGQVARQGSAPSAGLIRGLSHSNRLVQYACARAICRISPKAAFGQSKQVFGVLDRALAEKDARLVLVVSGKAADRASIVKGLNAAGHVAVQASSGQAGMDIARRYPIFDLVVLDGHLQDISTYQVYDTLKSDFRSRSIPVLTILGSSDPADRAAIYDGKVVKGAAGVAAKAAELMGSVSGDFAGRSQWEAAAAAQALATISDRDKVLVASASAAALGKALSRPDPVRIPAARALALHGGPAQLGDLLKVVSDSSASQPARLAAAGAIGAICSRNKGQGAKIAAPLAKVMTESDHEIVEAAGRALGQAGLSNAEVKDLIDKTRFSDSQKGALK